MRTSGPGFSPAAAALPACLTLVTLFVFEIRLLFGFKKDAGVGLLLTVPPLPVVIHVTSGWSAARLLTCTARAALRWFVQMLRSCQRFKRDVPGLTDLPWQMR